MNSRKLTANLTQLTKVGLVNAYLVREDEGLTLVDTTINAAGTQPQKLISSRASATGSS